MSESFSINLRHFLDERGDLPPDLPDPARRLALHNGAIVAWVTAVGPTVADAERTNVSCRRGRARPPCFGTVIARRQGDAAIAWHCDVCGEEGLVRGFEGTPWDRRRPDA